MKTRTILLVMAAVALVGCTDAMWGKVGALGGSGTITCYSGGKEIYKGESTGKIQSESQSDGYFFVDKATNKLTEVSGECVIVYNTY